MPKITHISDAGIDELVKSEGLELNAYLDTAGIPTIGIGTTRYFGGTRVKMGDKIDINKAYAYFRFDVKWAEKAVDDLTVDTLNQNQFDALVSFVYNLGVTAYRNSTLRKRINKNVNDPTIRQEMNKWVNSGGKITPGLVKRRKREADLYFSK